MKVFTVPHTTDQADEVLLELYVTSNDMEVLGELYSRHAEMVYYVCLRYFQDQEHSKDAVMQIFEQLITKVHKQEIANFAKWLYVVSKNFCLMEIRSKKNKLEVSLDEFVESPLKLHPQESYTDKEEQLVAMEKCMEQLPEKQRISVDLFFLNEKCYKEIVEITGFSMNEVKSFIQNGKRNLKNCIERNHE